MPRPASTRWESAEAIVPERGRLNREGPNVERRMTLESSRDIQRQQKTPKGASQREEAVKPQGTAGGPSVSPARFESTSHGTGTEALLEQVVERSNMLQALRRVEENDGAPGVDGMEAQNLRQFLRLDWERIRTELLAGTYKPNPVRRVEIPKPQGGKRLLGIPTVLDRLIQQALMQVLTPVFDPGFSESSYGFRPGRGAQGAVQAARSYIEEGYKWVVDMDLAQFFDRVNHDVLMARVARKVQDKRVLRLIRHYLEAGVMLGGVKVRSDEGTPQGGPLSPLLANILLDDLDKELESRGHRFARYADDCNIYVRSRRAGERVMQGVKRFVEERLKLKVNEEKSAVDRPWKRKFLGFTFLPGKRVRIRLASKTVERVMTKIRELTNRTRPLAMEERIRLLNEYLGGWIGYFRLAEIPSTFEKLDEWTRRRLRMCLWKQWKRGKTRYRNLRRLGLNEKQAHDIAWTQAGYWRAVATPQLHKALGLAYWQGQGLKGLVERYNRPR